MAIWIVTGKLRSGKTLMSVARIQKYLLEGRKVATNLNIYPEHMLGIDKKSTQLFRLPDIPSIEDFQSLPRGYEGDQIDESKNGLLVLDECGIFLDSRSWNNPKRKAVNAFFKLLGKLRWDAIFIIQDIENFDSDARRTIAEHVVYCRRMDRMRVPFISAFLKTIAGIDLPLPKVHMGIVLYGTEASSMKVDQWNYYGERLYAAYDTEQLFSETENFGGYDGLTTILPTYYTHGRYTNTMQRFKNAIRDYKVKSTHFFSVGALLAAFAVNALVTVEPEIPKKGIWSCNDAYKEVYGSCEAKPIALQSTQSKNTSSGTGSGSKASQSESDEPKEPVLYMSGWEKTKSGGYSVVFVDAKGSPYYPLTYRVKMMGDCAAFVTIEGRDTRITCMPDSIAYQQQPTEPQLAQQ